MNTKEGEKMKVLAISKKDHEYLYNAASAHKVAARSAERIATALNKINYKLKPGQIWFIHDVDSYDNASIYAEDQKFYIYKGTIKEQIYL